MDNLIEILNSLHDDVDYKTELALIDDGIFDSFDLVNLVSEIESCFHVNIPPSQIADANNFNSAQAMYALIQSLKAE